MSEAERQTLLEVIETLSRLAWSERREHEQEQMVGSKLSPWETRATREGCVCTDEAAERCRATEHGCPCRCHFGGEPPEAEEEQEITGGGLCVECHYCRTSVEIKKAVHRNGRMWHRVCWAGLEPVEPEYRCCVCGEPLDALKEGYVVEGEQAWHVRCHREHTTPSVPASGPLCHFCGKPMGDRKEVRILLEDDSLAHMACWNGRRAGWWDVQQGAQDLTVEALESAVEEWKREETADEQRKRREAVARVIARWDRNERPPLPEGN